MKPLLLSQFSDFINKKTGLYFPQSKWNDLTRGVTIAQKEFGFEDENQCLQWLMSAELTKKQLDILVGSLTVGETYFFRDDTVFHSIENEILLPLIQKRRQENKYLRIWSAGCSTGEEPYSIAMLLNRLIPDINDWNITLLATDINIDFLKKCTEGVYTEWSFRGVPYNIKKKYFNKISDRYEIIASIKNMVSPFYLNLSSDTYPSVLNQTNAMDMIICRNVLMYFSNEYIQKAVHRFYDCLVDDGYFVVGLSDPIYEYAKQFVVENKHGKIFYKKPSSDIKILETQHEDTIEQEVILPPGIKKIETIQDYSMLAKEYAAQGKLNEALVAVEKAIAQDKSKKEWHYLRAMILLELGDKEQAIQSLNRVLYLDAKFILAYVVMGNIFHQSEDFNEAKKYFEHALVLLNELDQETILPESGEMTAGRLKDFIHAIHELE